MPLIRTQAVQGHAVPHGYQRPLGPFPAEVLAQNPRSYQSGDAVDSLHEAYDDVRYFRCKFCGEILSEEETSLHECEDEDQDSPVHGE
jgi:hypothetical protein